MTDRSYWAWGRISDEPTAADLAAAATSLSERYGRTILPVNLPSQSDLSLRTPRVKVPAHLRDITSIDDADRAVHTYGRSFPDRIRAFKADFPEPPDAVLRPETEDQIEQILEWASTNAITVYPFGGGSSVVSGFEPDTADERVISLDMERFDKVLEIDTQSRAARIQAGIYGPALERELKKHGLTMRHFPQSFEFSTLGGWIATRSGGHYATNHTHIDDFVESVRMLTPSGPWESRRLPGSGAGPSPDRLVLGSEGIFGVITEAWVRLQEPPGFRASAGVYFENYEDAWSAAREIGQAKLWPANLRMLDAVEGKNAAGMDGTKTLLVIGFESSDVPQTESLAACLKIARELGGVTDPDEIIDSETSASGAGRQGAVGRWRASFIRAPYAMNSTIPLGLIHDTFETAVTWDAWPTLDSEVRSGVQKVLDDRCGGGTISCRFTHVYPDGPAPYYTFIAPGFSGGELEIWSEIKEAASKAIIKSGGTITHHHAVGKLHRPWYDQQRPGLFEKSLRATKNVLDPAGIMNPGVLID
ncbi:MAG: FAD-binding oxidoreductase [Chloroflexi bacterium]|nr:FAD-binding oxidoreductase [Chloroflexota bacterium]